VIRRRTAALAAGVSLALIGAACSGHGSSSSTTAPPTTAAAAATTTTAAGPGPGDFGTLKAVCGPGTASGATDKGVTDTEIRAATMSDPGNTAVPGLNIEMFQESQAFVDWCNAAGGILGRKITLDKRDAALFNVAAQMVASCQQPDFFLVGNGEALDATGVQQRLSCGLPEISGYDVSAAAGTAALSIQPLPTPDSESTIGGAFKALKAYDPASAAYYGLLSSTTQSIKDSGNRDKAAAAQLGYTQVYYDELPIQVNNWRPYAQAIQAKGVQVLGIQAQANQDTQLFKAFADIGYFPKWVLLNTNNYDPVMLTEGGTNLDKFTGGVLVSSRFAPFELGVSDPTKYPATAQFVNIVKQYQNVAPKALGVNSFSAFLLFAEAAKSCGSNVTRQCVMSYVESQSNWTAGGLHDTEKPANATGDTSRCFTLIKATSGGWQLDPTVTMPNQGIFNCDPANVSKLQGFPRNS
jgi:ABC-type branched-subunit amino acid transport system substrate-binding protein